MTELPNSESKGPGWLRFDLGTDRDAGLAAAQDALSRGALVVVPTDTVYGVAADALQPQAVQRLLDAKQRGRELPPPVLIAESAVLRALVVDVPVEVDALINRFWPGALTVIMKAQPTLKMDLGESEGTIAVRVPDQADTRELLRQTGPLAVSSANLSGQPPATSIDDAIAQLGDSVAVYLDAGPAPGPVPSTIIDLTGSGGGRILRSGLLSFAELSAVLPTLTEDSGTKPAGSVQAAGQERGSETERPPDA